MNKVLFPIQKKNDISKSFDVVKYPDGSVAKQLENVSRQVSFDRSFQSGRQYGSQCVKPYVPVNRVADKALPIRQYEEDVLFTRRQGMSGNNNENLSEKELEEIRANIERANRVELQQRRRYLYSDQNQSDDGYQYESEFI